MLYPGNTHAPAGRVDTGACLPDFDRGFDSELGLTYHELTPDGARAQLEIHDQLLQPWGIVHGGVYCSIIESLASVAGQVWLAENGGGTVVGVNNNTDFLRAISARHGVRGLDADSSRPRVSSCG